MDIALIVGQFPKLSKTFINNEITGMIDRGHNVYIIARRDPGQSKVHKEVEQYSLRDRTFYYQDHASSSTVLGGLKLGPTLAWYAPKNPKLVFNLLKQLPREGPVETGRLVYYSLPFFDREFDIIHAHFGPKAIIGAKLKRIGIKGKLIASFHGYGIQRSETGKQYEELFERADRILAMSQYLHDELVELGASPDKVRYHNHSIDTDKFECGEETTDEETIRLVTVARLVKNKGITYSLSAIAKLVERNPDIDIEYRVIGPGPLRDQLEQQAKDEKIDSMVEFLGPMPRSGVIDELTAADMFVLPSIWEGFGKVLLEAQASCLPIVASSAGGIPSAVLPDETALLVPPKNGDALADAIETLLHDSERREEMGQRGREHIENNHGIKKVNDGLEEIYRSVLESS